MCVCVCVCVCVCCSRAASKDGQARVVCRITRTLTPLPVTLQMPFVRINQGSERPGIFCLSDGVTVIGSSRTGTDINIDAPGVQVNCVYL